MKINIVSIFIAFAISLLIAYAFYSFHDSENKLLLTIGSFVFLSLTLSLALGTSFQSPRTTTNVRVVSGIFFTIAMVSNVIFSFYNFSIPSYTVINGIFALIYVFIVSSIVRAKQ